MILVGGSAHPKGSIFWRQMPGYQNVQRRMGVTYHWATTAFRHPPPHWASQEALKGMQTTWGCISEQVLFWQVCWTQEWS